jgi:hypothetical protein
MEKLAGMVSVEFVGSFTKLAKKLGIDAERYKPVKYENYPFFRFIVLTMFLVLLKRSGS